MAGEIELAPLPAEEAIAFFRAKGARIETQFDWRDWDARAHATAFTVAKSTVADVAGDIHGHMLKVLEEGRTFEQFKRELALLLQAKGWWGKAVAVDPTTGESQLVQLGSSRRLRVIFDTNLRMAYSHGRWQRIERRAAGAPWLRYVAVQDERTRPEHLAWHGTVLPVGHAWWQTHLPPNGWNCRCIVQQLSDRDLERRGLTPSEAPPPGETKTWRNARTGEALEIPEGIDPGFAHNVGQIGLEEHAAQFFAQNAARLPPSLATALSRASAEVVMPHLQRGFAAWTDQVLRKDHVHTGQRWVAGLITTEVEAGLRRHGMEIRRAGLLVHEEAISHSRRASKDGRSQIAPIAYLRDMPRHLAAPRAVLFDVQDPAVIYVADGPTPGTAIKYVFKTFRQRGNDRGARAVAARLEVTTLRTISLIDRGHLTDLTQYQPIWGEL